MTIPRIHSRSALYAVLLAAGSIVSPLSYSAEVPANLAAGSHPEVKTLATTDARSNSVVTGQSVSKQDISTLHYQPPGAIFGDPVPYYHDGVHHLFYLHRKLDAQGHWASSLDWNHLASRDLVHWQELQPAIVCDDNDQYIATGSIVMKDGVFHAFYSTADRKDRGPGLAAVRVATSKDLVTWTKESGAPLLLLKRDVLAGGTYDPLVNWRDPDVFWNPKVKQWWLAIAAHQRTGLAYPYAGVVALATSSDLRGWTVQREPLLATRETMAAECPDVFPLGSGWAMVYYTDTTRIRLAATPAGPWRRPLNDTPWNLLFDAGKTEFDGRRRIIHAYLPRVESDYPVQLYGGLMALPRELYLDDQGEPATRLVPEIIAACRADATSGKGAEVFSADPNDSAVVEHSAITLAAATGTTALALWKEAPADFFFTSEITLVPGGMLTLLLRGTPQPHPEGRAEPNVLDDSYALTLDANAHQVTLRRHDGWNRMPALRVQSLDLPVNRSFKLHVMLHGDVLEAFVDDRISFSARLQLPGGALALFARDGPARLTNVRIAQLPQRD